MGDRGEWSARAEAAAVGHLRRAVTAFADSHGMPPELTGDLRLCLSEAITNVVIHAFRGRPDSGTVSVTAQVAANALIVHVADDGVGFAPRLDSPGLGLGLPLIAELADELSVTARDGGGTVISMRFTLARPD